MKAPSPGRMRIAAAQYFIRPVQTFDQFADQVTSAVETAADYRCRLLVLPEYFTLQLVSLADTHRPFHDQLRDVAAYRDRFVELMRGLARAHGLYVVAGTMPTVDDGGDAIYNDAYVFAPSGGCGVQGKLHMTRFESEDWLVSPRSQLNVFETDFGKMAVAICYDVEFPELVRAAAHAGASLLVVPSDTDDRYGFLRVRYCAHARTIENQMFVVHAPTVGGLPRVPAVSLHYGSAAILTPSDFAFARDGVLAEGLPGQEAVVVGELDLRLLDENRSFGTVLPLNDSHRTRALLKTVETVTL